MQLTFTELREVLALEAEAKQLRFEREQLKQQIMDLVAGDEAMQAKVQAAFDKSEAVETKMRDAVTSRPA